MKETTEVQIKPNRINWQFFRYTENITTIFPGNAITFYNDLNATGDVMINDNFNLQPGQSLELGTNQNEVDYTVYKIIFLTAGAMLNVIVKTDAGINIKDEQRKFQASQILDRRITTKFATTREKDRNRILNRNPGFF